MQLCFGSGGPIQHSMIMTSTLHCSPWSRHPGLILGLGGMVSVVAARATSSTARPGGGNDEPPDPDPACPQFYSQWNQVAIAQTVIGSLSIVMCLAVTAVLCKGKLDCA